MKIYKFINFFLSNLKFEDWLKIFINYVFIFFVIVLEILFIYFFFLVLNQNNSLGNESSFLKKTILFINNYLNLDISNIKIQILFLCFFLFFKNIFQLYQNYFFYKFIYTLTARKSTSVFRNYLNFNYEKFKNRNISTYTKNVLRDVENIFLGILGLCIFIVGDLIYIFCIIFFSSYLIFFEFNFNQFFLFFIIIILLLSVYRLSIRIGLLRNVNESEAFKSLSESFNLFKEIKINNKISFFASRFDKFINKYYNSKTISGVINLTPKALIEIGFLLFFYFSFLNSNLSIEGFISKFAILIIIIFRVLQPISRIFTFFSSILYNLESFKILYNDLKISAENKKIKNTNKLSVKTIELKNITYYSASENYNKEIIKKFNFKFIKGKIYGLYGKSGSGKTTLLLLIAGLLEQKSGQIYFNESKIVSENIFKKYRISYLPQNPNLFDENIIFNIFLNDLRGPDDLKTARMLLNNFNFKDTSNTKKLFDSIKNFSGGEKQRIAFIRSIINNPSILLLDEPTSALDKTNESLVFDYLKKVKKNMIIIVSTHKISHTKYFDKIIKI